MHNRGPSGPNNSNYRKPRGTGRVNTSAPGDGDGNRSSSRNEARAGAGQRQRSGGKMGGRRSARSDAKMPPPRDGRTKPKGPWQKPTHVKLTSEWQLTDGKFQGKLLEQSLFPAYVITPQNLRDSVFKVLGRRARAARFLDICAGCGAVGLEAVSRGAMLVSFVERSKRLCSVIDKNLDSCGILSGRREIFTLEALPFLARMAKRRRFWDLVYFGPPCEIEFADYLKYFGNGTVLRPGGVLMIEHRAETSFPETIGLLTRKRVIVHENSAVSFFERK